MSTSSRWKPDRDWTYRQRADKCIAQGALTNSKRIQTFVEGVYATHAESGKGAHITDCEGRSLIDMYCGLGSCLMGHSHPLITTTIEREMHKGLTLSMNSVLELELCERLNGLFPFVDRWKLLKTGTEACMAAIRIARAYTGRDEVLSAGYHGWSDAFVTLTEPAKGVHRHQGTSKLDDPDFFDGVTIDTAAVIVEPVELDAGPERRAWLEALRARCTEVGALLIFDEIITGFRFPRFSVANFWGIQPDLILLGKAMAGGLSLAAVGGKAAWMDSPDYFVSSTFAGERLPMACSMTLIRALHGDYRLDDLWRDGTWFMERLNTALPPGLSVKGYATRGAFQGDAETKAIFWQEAYKAGILFGPAVWFGFQHRELAETILSTCRDIGVRMKAGGIKLEGKLPATPFAQQQREKA